jgi:hypothetical protein
MNPQPLPPAPPKKWGGHRFYKTRVRGIYQCRCGAQCMVVVRVADLVATLRAFNLYRHPLMTRASREPRGIIRARGWSTWTPTNPPHVTRRR